MNHFAGTYSRGKSHVLRLAAPLQLLLDQFKHLEKVTPSTILSNKTSVSIIQTNVSYTNESDKR